MQVGITPVRYGGITNIVDKPKNADLNNAIFKDENGNPRNDLGVFTSKETSPEVSNYIRNNLMAEHEKADQLPEQMRNDDAIIGAMPLHGETLNQYEERVANMLETEKQERKVRKTEKRVKDALKKAGFEES